MVVAVAPISDPPNAKAGSFSDNDTTTTAVIADKTSIPSSAFETGRYAAAADDATRDERTFVDQVTTATLALAKIPPSFHSSQSQPPVSSPRPECTITTASPSTTPMNESELVVVLRKQLQDERRHHEAAVQALQLRLYIAETRLKTHEEALAAHNRVVDDNLATTPQVHSCERHFSRVLRNPI